MSRRNRAPKRDILPDPVHKSLILAKFVNQVMLDGKKSVAEKIVYTALEEVTAKVKSLKAVEAFEKVLETLRPTVEVKSRRVGGATYQVPIEVRPERSVTLAMRWLIEASRKRREKSMAYRLAGEMQDILESKGSAMKKREDTHRMAEANKAFAHYRW
jgi:small subunit ribosomal protein S7